MSSPEHGTSTKIIHFGEEEAIEGAIAPPIFQTSTFVFDDHDAFQRAMNEVPQGPPYHYSRLGNPSVNLAASKIAMLESTDDCLLTGTGMGASALAILANVKAGSHVIAVDTCYKPVRRFLSDYLPRIGVDVTYVEGIDPQEFINAARPETSAIYLESPSTFFFHLQELPPITAFARERGITTIIDNTYATPLFANPAAMGVDLVVHSATKYMGGHSDVTAGAICGTFETIDRIRRAELDFFGSILAPFPAWLLLRGLRTLPLRMQHHQRVGNEVACWLEANPSVEKVHHVGLASFAQRALFQKQMRGSSSLLSFEPAKQEVPTILAFVRALKLFRLGVSWGGHESLVVPLEQHPMGYEEPRQVVRLYCGLEDSNDLVADLESALSQSGL